MANKLYNDTSVKAIADAIRAKNGTTNTYAIGEMATAITNIPSGNISRVEWHQCPEAVRNYLAYVAEHPYSDDNMDVTYIDDYAPSTPVDANSKPIAETVTGDGYRNAVPNMETPFSSGNLAGTIKPLDHLRWINTTSIPPAQGESYPRGKNTRDLGGWACDGGTVRYGMLIRGSEPNPADKELMVDEIGIKTEVQLLPISEQTDAYKMKSVWGIDWAGNDTNGSVYGLENPTLLVKIIRDIINSVTHDKPVYFHCGVGADRTGWIAMVLEAILGVSRCDIDTDYELTDFSEGWQELEGGIYRSRSYVTHKSLMEAIYAVPLVGGLTSSFRNHIISYLIANGMTIDEINAFRSACIDGTPTQITLNLPTYTITNNLTDVVNSNTDTSITQYQDYIADLTVANGYVISDVQIKLNDTDVTNMYFTGTKTTLNYSIQKNLTNCNLDGKNTVIAGQSYVAELIADTGFTMDGATITITMGGIDMSNYYSNGKIAIPNVTGNIVITATATASAKENLFLKDSTDTYKPKYRINSAGQIVTSNSSINACVTNKISINSSSYSITTDAENQSDRNDGRACVVAFYASDDTYISRLLFNSSGWTWSADYLSATLTQIPSNAAYMRFVLNYASLDNIKIYAE